MIEFFTENPFALLTLYCCLAPPGLLPVLAIFYVARRYNIRNPLTPREVKNDEPGQAEI